MAHETGVALPADETLRTTTEQIVEQAINHRISLVILRAKKTLGITPKQAEVLEKDVAAHLVAASLLISQTASLSGALTDAHIDHLVYKGAALGGAPGRLSSRGAGDVDVLVEPEDIARVDWVLKDLRYRPAQQLPPVDHRGSWKFITTIDREVAYTGRPVGVDMHWRISPPRHLFCQTARTISALHNLGCRRGGVPTAAAGDALAMACFHAYYDRFSQLRAMVDIHRLIPLALQSPLPPLSPALGRLTAGVLTPHRELCPGIVDDEITEPLTLLPKPLPMVWKVWGRSDLSRGHQASRPAEAEVSRRTRLRPPNKGTAAVGG